MLIITVILSKLIMKRILARLNQNKALKVRLEGPIDLKKYVELDADSRTCSGFLAMLGEIFKEFY